MAHLLITIILLKNTRSFLKEALTSKDGSNYAVYYKNQLRSQTLSLIITYIKVYDL